MNNNTAINTPKTRNIPCEIGDVIYVNIPKLPAPALRIVTEIRVDQNGIFITATNSRTGKSTIYASSDFGVKVFTDLEAAWQAR